MPPPATRSTNCSARSSREPLPAPRNPAPRCRAFRPAIMWSSTTGRVTRNWPNVIETLVPMREADGRWRVSQSLLDVRFIPPAAQDVALVVRAGRGQLSTQEQEQLASGKLSPALAQLLAEPRAKTFVELFGKLPDSVHAHVLKHGY